MKNKGRALTIVVSPTAKSVITDAKRTLTELMAIAQNKQQARKQKEREATERARRKQLEAIAPKAETLWQEVSRLIDLKQASPYD
jgi:hypothetical protein